MERQYRQKGYQDTEKPEKKRDRAPEGRPRQEQIGPRTPRMVGTVTRARCANCGAVLLAGFNPNGQCRAAISNCIPANSVCTSTPQHALSARSRSPSALPRRMRATIARSTNFAPRWRRTLRHLLPWLLLPRLLRTLPDRATPARLLTICSRSSTRCADSSITWVNRTHGCLSSRALSIARLPRIVIPGPGRAGVPD